MGRFSVDMGQKVSIPNMIHSAICHMHFPHQNSREKKGQNVALFRDFIIIPVKTLPNCACPDKSPLFWQNFPTGRYFD